MPAPLTPPKKWSLTRGALDLLFLQWKEDDTVPSKWMTFGLTELSDLAQNLPGTYKELIGSIQRLIEKGGFKSTDGGEPDLEQILTAQIKSGRMSALYLPSVFSYEGDLIVRCGNNYAVMEQKEDGSLKLGDLICKMDARFQEKGGYTIFSFDLFDREDRFTVSARTPREESIVRTFNDKGVLVAEYRPDKQEVETALALGQPISPYFQVAKFGGGGNHNFTRLRDLEVGYYRVEQIKHTAPGAISEYNITLGSGDVVSENSALGAQFNTVSQMGCTIAELSDQYAGMYLHVISHTWNPNKTACTVSVAIVLEEDVPADKIINQSAEVTRAPEPTKVKPDQESKPPATTPIVMGDDGDSEGFSDEDIPF